ncbi:MAG: DUF2029 domain-containing protein [Planctomycetes bacterium]|nr:DUF2029 domain-containing protein [Planctomycetota bacterium]
MRTESTGTVRLRRKPLLLFVAITVALSIGLSFTRGRMGDLRCYVLGARRMLAGTEIYRVERGPFTYPPFFAVPFMPICFLPEFACRSIWYFCNITMLGASCLLIARMAEPAMRRSRSSGRKPLQPTSADAPPVASDAADSKGSKRLDRRRLLLIALIVLLAGRHAISPVEYQAHDLVVFLLALLAIATWDVPKRWLPGFWAGLAAACKATPLLFLPVFVIQRRFRAAAALILTAAVATLMTDAVFPRNDGRLWGMAWYETFVSKVQVGAAPDVQSAWRSWDYLNQSLTGTLSRLSTPIPDEQVTERRFDVSLWNPAPPTLKATTLALQLAFVGLLLWFTRPSLSAGLPPRERTFHRLGEGGLILCGMLLLSPMSSKHHFCALLVPVTYCLVDFFYRRRSLPVLVLISLTIALSTFGAKDLIGRPLANTLLAYGALTWCTVAAFLTSCWVLRSRSAELRVPVQTVPLPERPQPSEIRRQAG